MLNPFVTTLYDTAYPITKIGYPGKHFKSIDFHSFFKKQKKKNKNSIIFEIQFFPKNFPRRQHLSK